MTGNIAKISEKPGYINYVFKLIINSFPNMQTVNWDSIVEL